MQIERAPEKIKHCLEQSDFKSLFSFDIQPCVEVHTFQRKELLCQEGEKFPYLYYLIAGKVRIFMSHKNGKISLINFLGSPAIIGELGLVGVETLSKGIEAMVDCICLAISLNRYQHILLNDALFLQHLCKILGEKTITRTERYAKSYNFPFENRLASFILKTEQDGYYLEKHTEVSEYLNVSYRHLLFVLNRFCQKKWLFKDERKYQILERAQLQRLANESDRD
ncbi:MAG: transcriptional regulator YeiL [Anaerolineaceae bacterium]